MYNPVKTIKTNTIGTLNMLGKHDYIAMTSYLCDITITSPPHPPHPVVYL